VNERASESCAREFDKNPSAKYCDDQRFQILQALISLHCASAAALRVGQPLHDHAGGARALPRRRS
jgi:hypothetical protein